MSGVDRAELAAFLRQRRARVQPADVGLEAGRRRRTPGLRRQEVAQLAGMSVDYYIRLEQGRGPRPSRQMIAAICRALRLSQDEAAYLHHLAGEVPGPPPGPVRDVRDVQARRSARKRLRHPVVGWLDLDCEALHDPDRDQWVVLYTAPPGTPSHEALRLLRVVGTQDLATRG